MDKENIKKKWDKILGGLIGTENRQKYIFDHREQVNPGPGRYNPSLHYAKYNNGGAGYMGMKIKTNGIMVPNGTHGTDVAPTSYEIGEKSVNANIIPEYIEEAIFKIENRKEI